MDHEGVGGFLESILAVMVVITASSVFLVVLSSGTLQLEEGMDREDLVSWMADNGLYSDVEAVSLEGTNEGMSGLSFPDEISGMTVIYRYSGNLTPLAVLNRGEPPQRDVLAFQLPLLIDVDGKDAAGIMEVRAWR